MTRNQPKPPETTQNQPKPALPTRNQPKRDIPSLKQAETSHCSPKHVDVIIVVTSNDSRGDSTPYVKGRWHYQRDYDRNKQKPIDLRIIIFLLHGKFKYNTT